MKQRIQRFADVISPHPGTNHHSQSLSGELVEHRHDPAPASIGKGRSHNIPIRYHAESAESFRANGARLAKSDEFDNSSRHQVAGRSASIIIRDRAPKTRVIVRPMPCSTADAISASVAETP